MNKAHLAAVGLAAALALSACSGNAPAAPTAGSAATQPTSAAQAASPTSAATTAPTIAPTTPPATPTVAPATPTEVPATPTEAPTSLPATTPAATQAATNAAAASGPALGVGDVQKMADALAKVKSFRMTGSGDAGQAGKFEMTVEVVEPDRTHTKITVGGQSFEEIQIGKDQYTNFGGKWTKSTSTAEAPAFSALGGGDPSALTREFASSTQKGDTYTKGALSTVNGKPCQQWNYNSTSGQSGTLCVGVADNLPLQFISQDGKVTVVWSDWNAPMTINAPI